MFLEEIYLHQVVVPTGVAAANALDGDLRVGVVVTIVVAHAHQFGVEGARCRLLHLGSKEIGKTLGGKAVNVVNGVALTGQTVDEHPCPRRYSSFSNREQSS